MEVLTAAPSRGSFTPLAEHQSTTPASFTSGPPVLHYHSGRCKVILLESELSTAPALSNLAAKAKQSQSNGSETNGTDTDTDPSQRTIENVNVWVTSEYVLTSSGFSTNICSKLFLFSNPLNTGLSISYPTISLHAIQSLPTPTERGLYMQLIPQNDDEEPEIISLTIIPPSSEPSEAVQQGQRSEGAEQDEDTQQEGQSPIEALFTALSDCSNLHPDPEDDDEEGSRLIQAGLALPGMNDGSLPPPMPGSGGWITAENMHEFVDEDGNFKDDEMEDYDDGERELGPGAGTVRKAEDEDDDRAATWRRVE